MQMLLNRIARYGVVDVVTDYLSVCVGCKTCDYYHPKIAVAYVKHGVFPSFEVVRSCTVLLTVYALCAVRGQAVPRTTADEGRGLLPANR